jgi:hypothetical protein
MEQVMRFSGVMAQKCDVTFSVAITMTLSLFLPLLNLQDIKGSQNNVQTSL